MTTHIDTSNLVHARSSNRTGILGWIVTGLFAAMMIVSGILYVSGFAPVAEGIRTLGYPDSFRVFIGVCKLCGAAALLTPKPSTLREWAYAGFVFDFVGAIVAHLSHGDGMKHVVPAIFALALVVASYALRTRRAR